MDGITETSLITTNRQLCSGLKNRFDDIKDEHFAYTHTNKNFKIDEIKDIIAEYMQDILELQLSQFSFEKNRDKKN